MRASSGSGSSEGDQAGGAPLAGGNGTDNSVVLKRDSLGNFRVGEHCEGDGTGLDRLGRRCRQRRAGCGGRIDVTLRDNPLVEIDQIE